MLIIVLVLLGLAIGPLLGIVVDRAVERQAPEAHLRCMYCAESLGTTSLIPIRTWFLRCPNGHRSWRYPVTDVATAAAFGIAGWRFEATWQLWPYLVFFAALVVMSVIDAETKLLLNILTFPTLGFGLFVVLVLSGANGFEAGIAPALWSGGLLWLFLFVAYRIYPAGMGYGDVKLAPSLGLFIGWLTADVLDGIRLTLYATIISFLLGGVVGIVLQRSRKAEVPLGPFLAVGTIAMIAFTAPAGI